MKIVILDWATVTAGDVSYECFSRLGSLTVYDLTPPERVAERIGDAEVVLCNKAPITSDVIGKCKNLKYIGLFATGYNNVDIPAATARGIAVCNAGSYSTEAVAQHTFAMILEHFSRISLYNNDVKDGRWISSPTFSYFPHKTAEINGKTLAVIGYGSIGRRVAAIGEAFGMKVIVSTRSIPKRSPYRLVTYAEAFAEADVLTIHCPLTEYTANMVCKENLDKMKSTALLINTSRGGVVNEADLAEALNNGTIAGAGLDVLVSEPMSADTPLKNAKNCIITPHIAWAAEETRKRLIGIAEDNLKSFINGNPKNKVN